MLVYEWEVKSNLTEDEHKERLFLSSDVSSHI
jgi:hypothetical protein